MCKKDKLTEAVELLFDGITLPEETVPLIVVFMAISVCLGMARIATSIINTERQDIHNE